jgi:hypothetical protein
MSLSGDSLESEDAEKIYIIQITKYLQRHLMMWLIWRGRCFETQVILRQVVATNL